MQQIGSHLQGKLFEIAEKPVRKRNNFKALQTEIWEELVRRGHTGSEKRYYVHIAQAKIDEVELLNLKKWAHRQDNFNRAMLGMIKKLLYERCPRYWPDA